MNHNNFSIFSSKSMQFVRVLGTYILGTRGTQDNWALEAKSCHSADIGKAAVGMWRSTAVRVAKVKSLGHVWLIVEKTLA